MNGDFVLVVFNSKLNLLGIEIGASFSVGIAQPKWASVVSDESKHNPPLR
jgi:hypothetical protein